MAARRKTIQDLSIELPRKGSGHKFVATDEERLLVSKMAMVGISHEQIALVVRDGIDADTLKRNFVRELVESRIIANAKIGGTLYAKAMAGDTASLIFWAKTQMGWRETTHLELTGLDGDAIEVRETHVIDDLRDLVFGSRPDLKVVNEE